LPLVQFTPPIGPAVDPEVVKRHLGIEHSEDDETVLELIEAATQLIQDECSIQLLDAVWQLKLDRFPVGREAIEIERPRVTEIEAITYVDINGDEQSLAGSTYQFDGDSSPARLVPSATTCWPFTKRGTLNAVTVRFRCGAATAEPAATKLIIALCADWYEERGKDDVRLRDQGGNLPDSPFYRRQLDHLRWI